MTSYQRAGVDLEGAEAHVRRIADAVTATWGPNVVGSFGGFAAGITIPEGYRRPVLMLTTDGVGTKLELARRAGRWEGVGRDLVAMCVDDLAAAGARPLALVDYMAVGRLDGDRDRTIVESIAAEAAGCALLGGETGPGVMDPGAVDLPQPPSASWRRARLTPSSVRAGDLVVGLVAELRSNGFPVRRSWATRSRIISTPARPVGHPRRLSWRWRRAVRSGPCRWRHTWQLAPGASGAWVRSSTLDLGAAARVRLRSGVTRDECSGCSTWASASAWRSTPTGGRCDRAGWFGHR